MTIRGAFFNSVVGLLAATLPCYAGPCSQEIFATQILIDAKLNAAAASGPGGDTSVATMDHRQPTPESIAAAELRLGDLSSKKVHIIGAAMAHARKADAMGNLHSCLRALAVARRALSH
jgi:hypothetical protein